MAKLLPPAATGRMEAWRWFRRLMAWVFVLALAVVAVAVLWLVRSGVPLGPNLLIAMSLGIVLSIMLGAGLMGLVFVSSRTGIDDGVAELPGDDDAGGR